MSESNDISTNPVPTEEDFVRYLRRNKDSGNWFPFSRDYLKIMSHDAAILIQHILNLWGIVPKNSRRKALREQGWVQFSEEKAEKVLCYSPDAQSRILDELQGKVKKKGKQTVYLPEKVFIEMKRFGCPPRRYVRVNIQMIEQAIDRVDGGGGEDSGNSKGGKSPRLPNGGDFPVIETPGNPPGYPGGKPPDPIHDRERNNKKDPPGLPAGGKERNGFFSGNGRSNGDGKEEGLAGRAKQLAKLFYEEIKNSGRYYQSKPPNLSGWSRELLGIVTDFVSSGKAQQEAEKLMEDLVRDHLKHIKHPYQPQLLTPRTLRKEKARVLQALERRRLEKSRPKSRFSESYGKEKGCPSRDLMAPPDNDLPSGDEQWEGYA